MQLGEWLALGAMVAALMVLPFSVIVELRRRRAYRPVDWEVDYIGPVNEDGILLFELTNLGSSLASQVSLATVGALPGKSDGLRDIRVVASGESKRFVAKPVVPLDDAWVLISWIPSTDTRYVYYCWYPLDSSGPLWEAWMGGRELPRRERIVQFWNWNVLRKVETVGPKSSTSTRARTGQGERRSQDAALATKDFWDWLHSMKKDAEEEGVSTSEL